MSSQIKRAVIPAAGLGTRMLPISHAVPKEMLPIVDLPAVYYLVEEAVNSGIEDVLLITNRDKDAMEDFFDDSPAYEAQLRRAGRDKEADRLRQIARMANIYFLRQKEAKGLGHAVYCARAFIGSDPFVVLYGDDIIFSKKPVCRQLIETYQKYGRPVVGVKPVSKEQLSRYCSLKIDKLDGRDDCFFCDDMIEKPKPGQEFSNYSILGRVLLTADIFDILENQAPGAGGEIQLTDAMAIMARRSGVTALDFEGERFDMGSKLGFLTANVVEGVKHPEVGEAFRQFLKEYVRTLD